MQKTSHAQISLGIWRKRNDTNLAIKKDVAPSKSNVSLQYAKYWKPIQPSSPNAAWVWDLWGKGENKIYRLC